MPNRSGAEGRFAARAPEAALEAAGDTGVAQAIKSTAGAIGYIDDTPATPSGLTVASIKNKAGAFVAPSVLIESKLGSHA